MELLKESEGNELVNVMMVLRRYLLVSLFLSDGIWDWIGLESCIRGGGRALEGLIEAKHGMAWRMLEFLIYQRPM